MKDAVLLLSGGLDSAANLVLGSFRVQLALTIDYGQRAAAREISQAAKLAKHFGVEHTVYRLPGFEGLVSSASGLFASGQGSVPVPKSGELDEMSAATRSAAAVWVPNRNGVLISLAAAFAESRGIASVAVGFNAEEAVTFPDNSVDFMGAMTGALAYSTANHVTVVSATSGMRKTEIVRELAKKSFPFELLWSCYHAAETPCGECESCQRLSRALREAGVQ